MISVIDRIGPLSKHRRIAALVLAIAACARAESPTTAPSNAPSIETIIAKSTEAAGGKDRLDQIKSIDVAGTMTMPQQNVSGTFTLIKKTDRAVMAADIPGIGKITSGWLGDIVYQSSDIMGARLIMGPEKEDLLRDLDMKKQFAPLEQLKGLKIVGTETIGNRLTWKLTGKTPTDRDETHWIDQQNYQTLRTKMQVMSEMGLLEATSDFSDYRTLDGITFPYVTTQVVGPGTVVLKLTDVKLNPKLADDRFILPSEVVKLAKRQATTTTTPSK